ncbi:LysM peptidoglycan-binding domain-containing protein [Winogradskyella maritima]|uniref:LysM peptidoglycan-binding domain-containing protein n=1 Tax=Winogradskyella maritima TaxID=1517766 RepID=A0ABV8AJR9_9FLAO|nr:LysM peptidoglycan-binding domain-containing protein [Winogradskyella maritima]
MKYVLILLLFIAGFSASAQNYKTHKVKSGETLETISKEYLVTPFDILALNPDAKAGLNESMTLIIPNSKVKNNPIEPTTKSVIGYKKHKVKRKETLFSLSQQYGVSIDDIKRENKQLYAKPLQKGDKIRIPRYKTVSSQQTLTNTIKKYMVRPREGKWRIAYKFGITVPELEDLNPKMNEVLQPGDMINVPNIANNDEKAVEDDKYNYYTVLKSEGFMALNRKLGLTQDELEALNPELKASGLKFGMVLKVPANIQVNGPDEINGDMPELEGVNTTDLSLNIKDRSTKRIALLLPFRLQRLDMDSIAEVKDMMKDDRLLSVTLDFHSGALMALDSASKVGISTRLKVFDTKNRISEISSILDRNDFNSYDAIIGPFMANNFDKFAPEIQDTKVPLISPVAIPKKVYSNVYQTVPSDKTLRDKMLNFVKRDSLEQNVVLIADRGHSASVDILKREFPKAKIILSEKDKKSGKDNFFIYPTSLDGVFEDGKTIVFLETKNPALASSVISLLNGHNSGDKEIVLSTLNHNSAFESKDVDNYHLSNLKFQYPSVNRSYDDANPGAFVKAYEDKYGVRPNRYASRGFDIMMDVLFRLANTEGNLYEASSSDVETEYVENKFRYNKQLFGGYINEAVYIVKYDDLRITTVGQ